MSTTSTNTSKAPTTHSRKINVFQKEAPNTKAVTMLNHWLQAAHIPVKASEVAGCDLTVTAASGQSVQIKVVAKTGDTIQPAVDHIQVMASDLTHRQRAMAIKAFHTVTDATGFGMPLPIDRGVDPKKKLNYEDNFELVAMRHKEFRKVPNPTEAELNEYSETIRRAVSRFMYINQKICRRHGLDFDDLKTYAQIWTCNFLGLYKVANPTADDNRRKLYAHLCQRFGNFVEVLLKKERNCIPDPQTASVAMYGRPFDGHHAGRRADNPEASFQPELDADFSDYGTSEDIGDTEEMDFGPDDTEMMNEVTLLDIGDEPSFIKDEDSIRALDSSGQETEITEIERRKLAKATLSEELGKLPHDRLLEVLTEASTNTFLCPDAQSEAKKQLRIHKQKCMSCLQAEKEAASANAGGTAEALKN